MSAPGGKEKSALLRALLAIEDLEARLREAQRSAREPIAIVGLACRYPGAENAAAFWRNLREGVDSVGEIPGDRWDIDAYYDADPDAPGKMYSRRGGFVRNLDCFDARFFGVAPREAVSLDPQQRLLLEVAWEALEDAAIPPHQLARTATGVFVGITGSDFSSLSARVADIQLIDPYSGTGSAVCVAAGRLSYILGLQGPSLAVDTACSSSLVALHLACQSLRLGECRTALAGGVNAILAPEGSIYFCKIRALSPEGRCKTFDAAADGYVRGEGCGVVVLKRLSDAVADRDRILAVIRGSAMNHDGPSGGLTIPNGPAQEAVIRAALANAGVQPGDVGYVEAHGTGTPLGDPIELHALGSVYPACAVGSVKTNIGHLEAGAGMAGLIKVVLALRHREIPPHLHFTTPNPLIPWERLPFTIPTSAVAWRERRIAGVSAFGFSGTNAHAIVEQAPEHVAAMPSTRSVHILTVSAKTEAALQELVGRYAAYLADTTDSLADICYTSNVGREHFAYRFAVAAESLEELRALAPTAHVSEIVTSYLGGAEIDWVGFHRDHYCGKVSLPGYPFQRERHWSDALTPQPSCLYGVSWEPCALPAARSEEAGGAPWLVLGPESFVAALKSAGLACADTVPWLKSSTSGNAGETACATTADQPLAELVPVGVIQFAPLDESDPARVCEPTLHLVQRLSRLTAAPRLWLVTQGAQLAGPRPAQSALWGLGAVIASEFPALRCTRIDLDPGLTAEAQALRVMEEIHADGDEDQVAWRGGQRYVRRLTRMTRSARGAVNLRGDATYLITGGLGAIGLLVAERFVQAGARHLLLVARRAPDAAAERRLDGLREKGARLTVLQGDVACAADVARAIEPHRATLRGVVHAAGVLDDGMLSDQNAARFHAVMAPKAAGAWNLHHATQGLALDFFVLFSSAAALIGPPGQGSYAAANAYLDGLAAWRGGQGLPALSIAWGPWSESGMAAATAVRGKARWRARGIREIAPKDGLDILQRWLGSGEPSVVVLPVDWNEFATQLPTGVTPPLLRELLRSGAAGPTGPSLRELLAEAPPNRRRAVLRDRVCEQSARVLGLGAEALDPREPLAELGLDSLMAVELRNVLAAMTGAQLPATLLFDYPTVDALTGYLAAGVLALDAAVAPPQIDAADTGFLKTIEELSEEEAESLLRQRLEAMQ